MYRAWQWGDDGIEEGYVIVFGQTKPVVVLRWKDG